MEVKHRTPPKLPPINRNSSSVPSVSSIMSSSSLSSSSLSSSSLSSNKISTPNKLRKPLPLPSHKLKTPPASPLMSPLPQLPQLPLSSMNDIPRPPPLDLSNSLS